ncbi:transposase [Streptomyces adustus]|uniref:transposase n=1 Tax=Streptomyces adustus TaxID=1609272 RepID=UPI0035DC3A2A
MVADRRITVGVMAVDLDEGRVRLAMTATKNPGTSDVPGITIEQGVTGLGVVPRPTDQHRSTVSRSPRCSRTRESTLKQAIRWMKRALTRQMDPYFVNKIHDLVGLYLDPPERVLVFGVVEASEAQSPDRSRSTPTGAPHRIGHDDVRVDASTPFAAPDGATRRVIGFRDRRRRAEGLKEFLRKVDREAPLGLDIHVVLDNYAPHEVRRIKTWPLYHRRFHLHVAPTRSSWLSLAERWFAARTTRHMRQGVHTTENTLDRDVEAWIAARNTNPRPYVWTKTTDQILEYLADRMGDTPDSTHQSGGADLFWGRLRAIDWAGVCAGPHHTPGAGVLIPRLLHGLSCAADPVSARWWAEELYEMAFHDHSGGYLRSAESMTPFLVVICDSNRAAPQAAALTLLAQFAGGFPTAGRECCQAVDLHERTMEAVRAGLPSYYTQLRSPIAQVRAAAFVLLSVLEHAPIKNLSQAERIALSAEVSETSPRFRQAMERLTATERDPLVLKRIQEAEIDPLFGIDEGFGLEVFL